MKARSYDLLCNSTIDNPPLPDGITVEEEEAYKVKFEEIALSYQDEAFSIYRSIIDYYEKKYVDGEFVDYAYARLYQNFPDEYGVRVPEKRAKVITSDSQWKCTKDSSYGWEKIDYNDAAWDRASKEDSLDRSIFSGFEQKPPIAMWDGKNRSNTLFFRRSFYLKDPPLSAELTIAAIDDYEIFINDVKVAKDSSNLGMWQKANSYNLDGKLRKGKNCLAIKVTNTLHMGYGLLPRLKMQVIVDTYLPKFPTSDTTVDKKSLSSERYTFPSIKNFSPIKKDNNDE